MSEAVAREPPGELLVTGAPQLLRAFNEAGVLAAADIHVAATLASLAGERDQSVMLAAALAVRAPRLGHVHVDLSQIAASAAADQADDLDLAALPWPAPQRWIQALCASEMVAEEDARDGDPRPLRLVGSELYLDRYWEEERQVAADLGELARAPAEGVDMGVLEDGLARLYADQRAGGQACAAACAVRRRLTVVAGGPGTGKTTTIARIAALLAEQAVGRGTRPPLLALAAPTGRAAARMAEAVGEQAASLDVDDQVRALLMGLTATTLHRLLGARPDGDGRFRHGRVRPLPHDVVIVDETSMVSLSLMARLLEAIGPGARLVLVGDPGQLVSIEAGAVLADIVGPAARGMPRSDLCARAAAIAEGIVVLDAGHRFGTEIAALAAAVREGDGDEVVRLLCAGCSEIQWVARGEEPTAAQADLDAVRRPVVDAAREMLAAARAGDARTALGALASFRVLCAHRHGPDGVDAWSAQIHGWLERELREGVGDSRLGGDGEAPLGGDGEVPLGGEWYVGRPLLVVRNDYELGLFNGDSGVVIRAGPGRVAAAFQRGGEIVTYSPTRLTAVQTLWAMTIHKSQGSQFDTVAVLLPDCRSRLLRRELLYTAITRARRRLIIAGGETALRTAVARPLARASGLGRRLWES